LSRRITPTKINLIRLRKTLKYSKRIYDILEDKRELLLFEINKHAEKANSIKRQILEEIDEVYMIFDLIEARIGRKILENIAFSSDNKIESTIESLVVAGIKVPVLKIERIEMKPIYGFARTDPLLDEGMLKLKDLLSLLVELANIENIIFRLAKEMEKTQKQLNALKYVIIPKLEKNIKVIKNVLEEREREEFVRLKTFKKILEKRKKKKSKLNIF